MFEINYTHSSANTAKAKQFYFVAEPGMTITEKVPNQARDIIQHAYALSQEHSPFTFKQLINYIDENHEGTFTNSNGGTERIVRYYSKLLQNIGVLSTTKPTEPESDEG